MKKSREEEKRTKKSTSRTKSRQGSSATASQELKAKTKKTLKKQESSDEERQSSPEQSLEKHFLQALEKCDLGFGDIFPYFFEEINQRFGSDEEGDRLYMCPEISDDILPKRDWQQKIMNEYVMLVLESDPIIASILLVRLLNSKETADNCFSIITRYLKNIIDNPDNERYRHIRYNNPIIISNVLETKGALMFLLMIGFEIDVENDEKTETFLSFNESHFHLAEVIKMIKDVKGFQLNAVEDYDENDKNECHTPSDRSQEHEASNNASSKSFQHNAVEDYDENDKNECHTPSDGSHEDDAFYKLTSKDLKKNQHLRALEIEKESQLRTKSMREREKRAVPKSKETRIRIRIPEGKIVDSKFEISDKLLKVYDYIDENLSNGKKYILLVPPATPFKETDKERTLADLHLYPAVLLTLKWIQVEKKQSLKERK